VKYALRYLDTPNNHVETVIFDDIGTMRAAIELLDAPWWYAYRRNVWDSAVIEHFDPHPDTYSISRGRWNRLPVSYAPKDVVEALGL
jgi:hypothetical protein